MTLISQRQHVFEFYRGQQDPRFCITTPIVVPDFRPYCRNLRIPAFQFLLFNIAKSSLQIPHLTLRFNDDGLYIIDELVVSYTVLDAWQNVNFTTLVFEDDLQTFLQASLAEKARVESMTEFNIEDAGRQNYLFCSALPWFEITGIKNAFSHPDAAQIPTFVFGKFREQDGELRIPFSFQAHHGLADGLHAAQFFDVLRENISTFVST